VTTHACTVIALVFFSLKQIMTPYGGNESSDSRRRSRHRAITMILRPLAPCCNQERTGEAIWSALACELPPAVPVCRRKRTTPLPSLGLVGHARSKRALDLVGSQSPHSTSRQNHGPQSPPFANILSGSWAWSPANIPQPHGPTPPLHAIPPAAASASVQRLPGEATAADSLAPNPTTPLA
jgi:hypothetical protein